MKKLFSVAGTRVIATVAQGLTLLLLTQSLGPVAFGAFAALTATFVFVASVVGFGSGQLALRVQGADNPKSLASSVSLLRFATVIIAVFVVTLIGVLFFDINQVPLLLVGVLFGTVEANQQPIENILFGLEYTRRAQFSLVCRRIAVLLAVVLGFFWELTLELLIITLLLILVLSPLWLVRLLASPHNLVDTLKLSLPFWGADLLAKVQSLDVVIASLVLSPLGAGVYAAASRVSSPLNILAVSTLSVLTPELSRKRGEERLNASRRGMRVLGGISLGLLLASPLVGLVLEWLLGGEYRGVAWPAAVLCISAGLAALNQGHVAFLYASGAAKRVFVTRLCVIPLTMLSGIPLGYWWGSVGIAIAVCLVQLFQVGALKWQVNKVVGTY